MNHSGDAAEQIVRMSLEGVEVAAKITGNAAKEIAMLLLSALKSPDKGGGGLKLKGKARMASMLKSGKALEIYSVKESDLKKFYQGAKQYGIVYCVLRNSKNTPDGLCDILVRADDAPKISRVAERFKFATVDKAKIESEIVADRAERAAGTEPQATVAPDAPDINDTDKLADDLLGGSEGAVTPEQTEAEKTDAAKPDKEVSDSHPLAGDAPTRNPSEPTSTSRSKSERVSSDSPWAQRTKPSVKEELREITAAQKASETDAPARDQREDKAAADKAKSNPTTRHQQPQGGIRAAESKKTKSKKSKERA